MLIYNGFVTNIIYQEEIKLAVPKSKTSKSKRDKRRTHYRLGILNITECPRCHSKKISHRVCENCGYYAENEIIIFEKKDKKKENKEKKEKSEKGRREKKGPAQKKGRNEKDK